MRSVKRSALVRHSAATLYHLVNDVASYPEFLPWCSDAGVIRADENEMVAWLELSTMGLVHRFTTRNILTPCTRIDLNLEQGPFSRFGGAWSFEQLGTDGSKVSLNLQFDFKSRTLGMGFAKVFGDAADRMVDAFCQRADEIA